MKKNLLILIIAFSSCTKSDVITEIQQNTNDIYYRIKEVDVNGVTSTSIVRYIDISSDESAVEDDGNHEEEDDEDDHHCLPIKLETFTLTLVKAYWVRVDWSASNEENVLYYILERSNNSTDWFPVVSCTKSVDGHYTMTDKIFINN